MLHTAHCLGVEEAVALIWVNDGNKIDVTLATLGTAQWVGGVGFGGAVFVALVLACLRVPQVKVSHSCSADVSMSVTAAGLETRRRQELTLDDCL